MFYPDTDFSSGKKVIFYGAGPFGQYFLMRHCIDKPRVPVPIYFCDDFLGGKGLEYNGIPILSISELGERCNLSECIFVIMALAGGILAIAGKNARWWDFCDVRIGKCLDMQFELSNQGEGSFINTRNLFCDEKSRQIFDFATKGVANGGIWFRSIFEPNPYFGNDVISKISDDEVFIDAGACGGEDILALTKINSNFRRIAAFEPDPRVFPTLASSFSDSRIEVYNQGLSDSNSQAYFDSEGACGRLVAASNQSSDSFSMIKTVRLDDCDIDGITFIKMDIEGSEECALRGATQVIKEHKPKLAISAYHLTSDLFRLPEVILEMRQDYKLFVRHHSVYASGTVIYAF